MREEERQPPRERWHGKQEGTGVTSEIPPEKKILRKSLQRNPSKGIPDFYNILGGGEQFCHQVI